MARRAGRADVTLTRDDRGFEDAADSVKLGDERAFITSDYEEPETTLLNSGATPDPLADGRTSPSTSVVGRGRSAQP